MLIIALVVLTLCTPVVSDKFIWGEDQSYLPHSVELDDDNNYHLSWNFDDQYIWFEVTVKTRGYIGFGFSPNGGMAGSDIVIGWVDESTGQGYLSDRHAVGQSEPLVDSRQDYTLHYSHQNDTHTVLQISRKLQLCGDEDHFLKDETVRLIWAHNKADPSQDGSILYHDSNRGNKNLYLLNPQRQAPPLPANVIYEEFRNPQVVIPTESTTYWCQSFPIPKLDRKHHVIRAEPIIQPGLESEVHHIILYACNQDVSNETIGKGHECYHRNMPPDFWGCVGIVLAWAIGGQDLNFPENVGLPFGYEDDPTMLLMETHYDNPRHKAGLVDSSGFRLTLTPDLRVHDAGIIQTGSTVGPEQIIPPFAESFRTVGHCYPGCLKEAMEAKPQGIKVFGTILHSHLLGHALRIRHFRQGVEQPVLAEDNNYDFNYQDTRIMEKEVDVLPGDHFTVECDYRSTHRTAVTYGGLSTEEEMCLVFVLYYPKIKLSNCQSAPTSQYLSSFLGVTVSPSTRLITAPPEHAGKTLYDVLENDVDWQNEMVRKSFQNWAQREDVDGFKVRCLDSGHQYPISGSMTSIPKEISTLPEGQTCGSFRAHLTEILWALIFIAIFAAC